MRRARGFIHAEVPLLGRARHCSKLMAQVGLLALIWPSGSAAQEVALTKESSFSRTEQLRQALIDEALEAPLRVSSSAWLDESGRLRHVTRFYSDLRKRALAGLQEDGGPVPAGASGGGVSWPAMSSGTVTAGPALTAGSRLAGSLVESRDARAAGSSAGPDLAERGRAPGIRQANAAVSPPRTTQQGCTQRADGLRREAWIGIVAQAHDGGHGHATLLQVGQGVRDELERSARASTSLKLASIGAFPRNTYEHRIASDGRFDLPYLIEIAIGSSGTPDLSLRPGDPTSLRVVTATVSLIERAGERRLFRRSYSLPLPGSVPVVGRTVLSPEVMAGVLVLAHDWWLNLQEFLACEPIRVQAISESSSLVSIPVGAGAGVRPGDRWVVSDAARIPARVLEQGALEGLRVAEVVSVMTYRSLLRLESTEGGKQLAPGSERGVAWFASPM